jgi:hypothetical protein
MYTGGNEARNGSAKSSIVETTGNIREMFVGDPLMRGENPKLSMELPDRELGLRGPPARTREKPVHFSIPR